jgi:hypothetical protein
MTSTPICNVLEDAIKSLALKAKDSDHAPEAMQFTQAALNLAHAQMTFLSAAQLKP